MKQNKFLSTLIFSLFLLTNPLPIFAQGEKMLVPGGQTIGVTLEAEGVLISAIGEVSASDGTIKTPAADAGLCKGDIIKSVNKKNISSVEELSEVLESSCGKKTEIGYQREKKLHTASIIPAKAKESGKYCIGAWVKDAASGIGTLTYIDIENNSFAALGHGICNPDTGNLIPLDNGKILKSEIISVEKGEKGIPGQLKGVFSENKDVIGTVITNNQSGLYGTLNHNFNTNALALPVAKKEEITKGKAQIFACVSPEGTQMYEIEIIKIFPTSYSKNKDMIIKITDERLKEKTGGIVQGMSGSPIIQNGKIVGAVTHVFVNDPTRGYGIFIENMLAEAEKIK